MHYQLATPNYIQEILINRWCSFKLPSSKGTGQVEVVVGTGSSCVTRYDDVLVDQERDKGMISPNPEQTGPP